MLIALAQRWADNQCCRCIPSCPDYKTPISGDCFDLTVIDVGIYGVKCCMYIADLLCLHGNIDIAISLFFGALNCFLDFFVLLGKICRVYSFI